jgi:hypothetical protein
MTTSRGVRALSRWTSPRMASSSRFWAHSPVIALRAVALGSSAGRVSGARAGTRRARSAPSGPTTATRASGESAWASERKASTSGP